MFEAVTPLNNAPDFICMSLTGALGAEVFKIDVSDPLDSASVAAPKAAFLERKVLTIHDQILDPASLFAFSRHWGDVHFYPYMSSLISPKCSRLSRHRMRSASSAISGT